jgi:alpha/beta superfamily hydrolase
VSRWAESESWTGTNLRREVFYFPSQGEDLYGSVYGPLSATPPLGIVVCGSWGFEGNQASRIAHWVSYGLALAGAAGFCFHYPGFGDSYGNFAEATLDRLASATVDATLEASRRHPETRWVLVGPMLGASVAALAADRGAEVERLLFVQPALRPAKYFARLERASRRSIGRPPPVKGFVYGYPLSPALLESVAGADAAVEDALSRFSGEGTIFRYAEPAEVQGAPERFEQFSVPGAWRFGKEDTPELIRATSKWLRKDSGMLTR